MKKTCTVIFAFAALFLGAADLYLAGDSTMCNYSSRQAPLAGWGMFLTDISSGKVVNQAIGGRGTLMYREKHWDSLLQQARRGDMLVIQFGHNDVTKVRQQYYASPENYAANLELFISEARAAGLFTVLVTPTAPRKFNKNQQPVSYLLPYAEAVIATGKKCNIPVIDMHKFVMEYLRSAGPEKSKESYLYVAPGTFPAYPEGREDDVHLNIAGAKACAEFFIAECRKSPMPELANLFK